MNSSRRRSREAAFQVDYAMQQSGCDRDQAVARLGMIESPEIRLQDAFSARLLDTLAEHGDAIDARIAAALTRWTSERLSAPDRSLLRLGVAEILWFDDVPPRAAINEYIELAKIYGDTQSPRFVNGILDRIYRDSEDEKKAPRGKETEVGRP